MGPQLGSRVGWDAPKHAWRAVGDDGKWLKQSFGTFAEAWDASTPLRDQKPGRIAAPSSPR